MPVHFACHQGIASTAGPKPAGGPRPLLPVPGFCQTFWFGHDMQSARRAAYHSLRQNIGAELLLVNETNLDQFEIPAHTFHRAVRLRPGLAMVHRGDYLRAYFMHFYGGGYHDVKGHPSNSSWASFFGTFEASTNLWVLGSERVQ